MKKALLLFLLIAIFGTLRAAPLETAKPEEEGVSSQAILNFVQAAEDQIDALHSVMVLRHGKVIAQGWWSPYNAASPHMLYSLSKSFTSTAIGLAVAEGRLSLDDTVVSFFPDEAPAQISDNLKAMRIRDLLAMNSGHQLDTSNRIQNVANKTWVEAFLALPVEHKPGTHFVYNSGASFMLSAIIQKVTGYTLLDYLTPRLFEPLGIKHPTWETNPQGINMGGWGLKITTEDIARFGQLYLQKGVWQGKRILPESWIAAATSRQTSNGSNPDSDWEQGYGYQFWRCRHNIYRGDGAFGQYCIVMPDQDAVIAITSGVRDMQAVMNLVWDILLPAMQPEPLAADEPAAAALAEKLAHLSLKTVPGEATSKIAGKVARKAYLFENNDKGIESVKFDLKKNGGAFTLRDAKGEQTFSVGYGEWVTGATTFNWDTLQPIATSGTWTLPDTYTIKLCFYETPYITTLSFQFADKQLLFNLENNVSFGGGKWETLTARRQ
jgi:CubicO group peptidase (beta-lactamase class C family)